MMPSLNRIMIVLLEASYWALASLFMTVHPPRKFGESIPYPDYRPIHTVMKVAPMLVASAVNPLMLWLVLADVVLDAEYHDPSREHYFHLGCAIYACYHAFQVVVTGGQFSARHVCGIAVLTSVAAYATVKLLRLERRLHRLYTATIVAHLVGAALANNVIQTLAVGLLGAGDCLLIVSRQRDIPYKDQITMLSTYLHVYMLTF